MQPRDTRCNSTLFVVCAHFKQITKLRIDNCSFNAEQNWVHKHHYTLLTANHFISTHAKPF